MNDWSLLQKYIAERSEQAFAELVQRHIQMVYGTALRQVREVHAAEDVTQAVFILFARKAHRLSSSIVIGGWLYRTAVLISLKLLRDKQRREAKERQSALMLEAGTEDRTWEEIAPHLDDALSKLNTVDRDSIVLRYIEQRSFREVAEALRISEDAAKKRVHRALEKLRAAISSRGIPVTAAALASCLAASAQAQPASTLASLCVTNSLSVDVLSSATVDALVNGFLRDSWKTSLKWAVALGLPALVLTLGLWRGFRPDPDAFVPDNAPLAVASAAVEPQASGSTSDIGVTNGPGMTLHLIAEENAAPLIGADVYYWFHSSPGKFTRQTDSDGAVRIDLPQDFRGVAIWAGAPGRVPKQFSWHEHEAFSLPANYTIRLSVGHRILGRVIDEQGNGVAKAALIFNGGGNEWNRREAISYDAPFSRPITDKHGYWEADFFAAATEWVAGRIEHPDFAVTTFRKQINVSEATNHVLTIQRGGPVAGSVVDTAGEPIANASLGLQDLTGWRNNRTTSTDHLGRFEFDRIAEGRFALRATAPDFMRADLVLPLGPSGTNLHVSLQSDTNRAGNAILRGRLLDHSGRPAHWPSVTVVYTNVTGGNGRSFWHAEVDRSGRFEWRYAPEGMLDVRVSAFEQPAHFVQIPADGIEHEIRLPAQEKIKLRGVVLDAENGSAIKTAKLMLKPLSVPHDSSRPEWLGEAYDGKFEFVLNPAKLRSEEKRFARPTRTAEPSAAILMVEAENYRRQSIELPPGTNDVEVRIELQPGGTVNGRAVFANQLPGAGAVLAFGTKTVRAYMKKPGIFERSHDPNLEKRAVAAADGTFDLGEAPFNALRVLAVHEHGWANVPISSLPDHEIILNPWSRVEGVIRVRRQGGETLQVLLSGDGEKPENMSFSFYADLDEQGRFVFEKVPGGSAKISLVYQRSTTGVDSHGKRIDVPLGSSTNIVIGGEGVKLSGRLVPSIARDDIDWSKSAQHLQGKMPPPSLPGPSLQSYGFFCEPDGSFVIEGVLPGAYRLILSLTAKDKRVDRLGNEMEDTLGHEVKEITVGNEDLDLDNMRLTVRSPEAKLVKRGNEWVVE